MRSEVQVLLDPPTSCLLRKLDDQRFIQMTSGRLLCVAKLSRARLRIMPNSLLFLLQGVRRQLLCNSLPARVEFAGQIQRGALAQLGERLICIQEVRSSILLGSTNKPFQLQSIEGPGAKDGSRQIRSLSTYKCLAVRSGRNTDCFLGNFSLTSYREIQLL